MSLAPRRSDLFNRDFQLSYCWYLEQASGEVAEGFLKAVLATLRQLATHPGLGVQRRFRHPRVRGIRSFKVEVPFGPPVVEFAKLTGAKTIVMDMNDQRLAFVRERAPNRIAPWTNRN